MEKNILRAVDANLNRVGEGLRVIEDLCRFLLVDANTQQQLKGMRHHLRSCIATDISIKYRDSPTDIGFSSVGELERQRKDIKDLLHANFKRIQEGLRTLEELLKLDEQDLSVKMKAMRYEIYEIEHSLWCKMEQKKLAVGLYLVLTNPPGGYEALTEMAVQAELPAVQLRCKGDDAKLFRLACRMREITKGSRTLFIVNDRPDIALMAQADGVHIGQGDLPAKEVRQLIGKEMLLGLSTHNLDQVAKSNDEPIDYIGFGPLYTTNSKERSDPVTGPEALTQAAQIARLPIVAIGGLTPSRISLLDPGTYNNIAVIRAVTLAENPFVAMKDINKIKTDLLHR